MRSEMAHTLYVGILQMGDYTYYINIVNTYTIC